MLDPRDIHVELYNSDRQLSLAFTHPKLRSYIKTKLCSVNVVFYRWWYDVMRRPWRRGAAILLIVLYTWHTLGQRCTIYPGVRSRRIQHTFLQMVRRPPFELAMSAARGRPPFVLPDWKVRRWKGLNMFPRETTSISSNLLPLVHPLVSTFGRQSLFHILPAA